MNYEIGLRLPLLLDLLRLLGELVLASASRAKYCTYYVDKVTKNRVYTTVFKCIYVDTSYGITYFDFYC